MAKLNDESVQIIETMIESNHDDINEELYRLSIMAVINDEDTAITYDAITLDSWQVEHDENEWISLRDIGMNSWQDVYHALEHESQWFDGRITLGNDDHFDIALHNEVNNPFKFDNDYGVGNWHVLFKDNWQAAQNILTSYVNQNNSGDLYTLPNFLAHHSNSLKIDDEEQSAYQLFLECLHNESTINAIKAFVSTDEIDEFDIEEHADLPTLPKHNDYDFWLNIDWAWRHENERDDNGYCYTYHDMNTGSIMAAEIKEAFWDDDLDTLKETLESNLKWASNCIINHLSRKVKELDIKPEMTPNTNHLTMR